MCTGGKWEATWVDMSDNLAVEVATGALSTRKQRAAQHYQKARPSTSRNAFLI